MTNAVPIAVPSLKAALQAVPDRRQASGKRHQLSSILAFVSCGMLCGAKSLLAIFEWGRAHQDWCMQMFGFVRCTPSVNTLHLVLKNLDVAAFEAVLSKWAGSQCTEAPFEELQPVAIDGKTIRGSKSQGVPGVHLLSAFANHSGTVLAQVAVSSQDNEITQAQPLLEQLNLNGIVVTGDAMFTQRRVCEQIINQGGNYLFEVKNNQSRLKSEIARLFLGA